jgi:hypothetical protein
MPDRRITSREACRAIPWGSAVPPLFRWVAPALVPTLYVAFVVLFLANKQLYRSLADEDSWIQNLTFIFLLAAGIVSLMTAGRLRERGHYRAFFLVLGVALVLAAFEEISWGQRIFGMRTPEFFTKHSDHNEINIHNLAQGQLGLKTRHVVGVALLIYGGLFPLLTWSCRAVETAVNRMQIPIPALALVPSFVIAFPLMLDWPTPTGRSEEYGEFLYAVCLLLFIVWWSGEWSVDRRTSRFP